MYVSNMQQHKIIVAIAVLFKKASKINAYLSNFKWFDCV